MRKSSLHKYYYK